MEAMMDDDGSSGGEGGGAALLEGGWGEAMVGEKVALDNRRHMAAEERRNRRVQVHMLTLAQRLSATKSSLETHTRASF